VSATLDDERNTREVALSVKALSWAFDVQIDDPLAKLVLLAIANNHNEAHGIAWPSVAHLCRVTGASERTVRNKLVKLEDAGLIGRKYRNGRSTQYYLFFDTPARDAPLHEVPPTPARGAPITYKEPLKKKKGPNKKIRFSEWTPSEADRQYARDHGHDPDDILTSMRLWDEAKHGNTVEYVSPSAAWKQWIRREKPARNKVVQHPVMAEDKHTASARRWLERWDTLSDSMKVDLRHRNPVLDRMLKKSGD